MTPSKNIHEMKMFLFSVGKNVALICTSILLNSGSALQMQRCSWLVSNRLSFCLGISNPNE